MVVALCTVHTVTQICYCRKASVTFKFADGGRKTVEAKIGTNLLDVVLDHDVDVDGFGKYILSWMPVSWVRSSL